MYCKKCGKFIGNDADLCDECASKEQGVFSEFAEKTETVTPTYYQPAEINTDAINLGKSIAAIILSNIGFWLAYIVLIVVGELVMLESIELAGAIFLIVIAFVPCLLGFIFGIQSISNFKATSMIKSGKRIPVLILGISSVIMASLGLLFTFLALILSAMI